MLMQSLNNHKGQGLIGALIAAAVGGVILLGLTKYMATFAEQSSNVSHKRRLAEIETNAISILRSIKAWNATVTINSTEPSFVDCYPGKNANCPLIFYYNPNNPTAQADYNAAGAVAWTCSYKNIDGNQTGIGVFTLNGRPLVVDKAVCAARVKSCMASEPSQNPLDAHNACSKTSIANLFTLPPNKEYIIVTVSAPIGAVSDINSIPNFNITLEDISKTGKVSDFDVFNPQDDAEIARLCQTMGGLWLPRSEDYNKNKCYTSLNFNGKVYLAFHLAGDDYYVMKKKNEIVIPIGQGFPSAIHFRWDDEGLGITSAIISFLDETGNAITDLTYSGMSCDNPATLGRACPNIKILPNGADVLNITTSRPLQKAAFNISGWENKPPAKFIRFKQNNDTKLNLNRIWLDYPTVSLQPLP